MNVEFYVIKNLTDVWTFAAQKGEGLIVCHTEDVEPKVNFNPENYRGDSQLLFLSPDKKVFVVNCDHGWFKGTLDLSKPEMYIDFTIGGPNKCVVSNNLANDFIGCEVPSEPVPESIAEPEPSDFEVETWVPQDELPDNGE